MAPYNVASVDTTMALEKRYFPYPNSVMTLTPTFRKGLIPVAIFAMMSLVSVITLLGFITHRLISWRKHYRQYVGYNQHVILIYNLLLADLQQSISFSISFHWLRLDAILAPTAPCFLQGWFMNIGNVSSGLFVLAIAIHTWLSVVKGYKMPYMWFVISILGIWLFALLVTVIGPAMHQHRFYTQAGGWCWISSDFQDERLWLHYIWIFTVEFGTIAIYGHIFIHLRGRIRSIWTNDTSKLTRATKFMILYPIAYLVLTLPIAVGRMIAMRGQTLPDTFFVIAGSLLTSCGWVDALLYTLTRRILVSNDLSSGQYAHTANAALTNPSRPGDEQNYGLESMTTKEPITATARTVTIVGGSNRLSRIVETRRGRGTLRSRQLDSFAETSPTRSGSQDSIIKPTRQNEINIVTETNIHVETASHGSHDSHDFAMGAPSPSRPTGNTDFSRES